MGIIRDKGRDVYLKINTKIKPEVTDKTEKGIKTCIICKK